MKRKAAAADAQRHCARRRRPCLDDLARAQPAISRTPSRPTSRTRSGAPASAAATGRTPPPILLRTNRSRTIGVVIPDITDPVFPPIIRGIEDGLAQHDYVAILANTDGDPRRQTQVIEAMRAARHRRPDPGERRRATTGWSSQLAAGDAGRDRSAARPTTRASRRSCTTRTTASVSVLTHLVSLGHRRIAAIAGPQTVSTGYKRYTSFVRHREALGLDSARRRWSRSRAPSMKWKASAAPKSCWSRGRRFSAVVCANDRLAVGAITRVSSSRHRLSGRRLGHRFQRHDPGRSAVAAADHRARPAPQGRDSRPPTDRRHHRETRVASRGTSSFRWI